MPIPLSRFKKPRQSSKPFLRAETANGLRAETVADALGLGLKVQGRHVELENGIRGTYKPELVWCAKDGTGLGDNCALVMQLAGVDFRRALELLLGHAAASPAVYTQPAPVCKVLRIPSGSIEDRQSGRKYLLGRGISTNALNVAEKCGMLQYAPGAVLFLGLDEDGQPRSATRRGYLPADPAPKRDLAGTDKSWPAFLPGLKPDELWIVEGGADALALLTLRPFNYPSVLVSGGVHVTSWLDNPAVQQHLRNAAEVVVACEWEKDETTQAKTDAQRQKLAQRLEKLVPCAKVELWMPREDHKDLAEMLSSVAPLDSCTNDDKEME